MAPLVGAPEVRFTSLWLCDVWVTVSGSTNASGHLVPYNHVLEGCTYDSYKKQSIKAAKKHHLYTKKEREKD